MRQKLTCSSPRWPKGSPSVGPERRAAAQGFRVLIPHGAALLVSLPWRCPHPMERVVHPERAASHLTVYVSFWTHEKKVRCRPLTALGFDTGDRLSVSAERCVQRPALPRGAGVPALSSAPEAGAGRPLSPGPGSSAPRLLALPSPAHIHTGLVQGRVTGLTRPLPSRRGAHRTRRMRVSARAGGGSDT